MASSHQPLRTCSFRGLTLATAWALAAACGGDGDAANPLGSGGGGGGGEGGGDGDGGAGAPAGPAAALALPEYLPGLVNAETDVFNDPLSLDCVPEAVYPQPAGEAGGATVTVRGLLTKFGKARRPVSICVAVLDYDRFVGSACATGASADRRDCFGKDLCAEPGALGPGVVLGTDISVEAPGNEEAGAYEIAGIPVARSLVIRASGPGVEWVDTYKYGLFIPADQAALGAVEVEASIISKSSWQTVPATAMVPRGVQPDNGAIAGTVSDCGGTPDPNVTDCDPAHTCAPGHPCDCSPGYVCLPKDGGGACTRLPWSVVGAKVGVTPRPTNVAYFQGREGDNLPQPGRQSTNILGTYAAIDAPGGWSDLVATASDGSEVRELGRARIFLVPQTVALLSFRGTWTGHFPWYI